VSEPGPSRRSLLRVLATAPLAALVSGQRAEARDYASAAEVLAEIDRLEASLDARLGALTIAVAAAGALARSVQADHDRHRRARAGLRRRLGLAPRRERAAAAGAPPSVEVLRAIAQDLVHAHAEGLPALRDAAAVDLLARNMVDDARHLAILQMWVEAEGQGG